MDFLNFFSKSAPAHPPLFFLNSASGKKEEFHSLKPGVVSMYSCGPTVYDHIHIGNLRSFLLADLVKRVLMYNGYEIKHVINFTDFGHLTDDADAGEDKMMRALKREGKTISLSAMREVAEIYMQSFKDDNDAFRNIPPTKYTPRVITLPIRFDSSRHSLKKAMRMKQVMVSTLISQSSPSTESLGRLISTNLKKGHE
jgi:hypothetical protein